jgi:UPF0271 protein
MLRCDLNCDLGEGIGNDAAIMPFITSANVACGYHAGDRDTMKRTIDLCLQYNVAIGAHPSYPDKENFGRIDLIGATLKVEDIYTIMIDQMVMLQTICTEAGAKMYHVKPHGALYNRAATDEEVSAVIYRAIKEVGADITLYGLSGSQMKKEADRQGLVFRNEVFADRTYQDDGTLTPRTETNALIEDAEEAVQQVLKMVNEKMVCTVSGNIIPIIADTICIHGDGKKAVVFAKKIYEALRYMTDNT